jgi:hypothetical protein
MLVVEGGRIMHIYAIFASLMLQGMLAAEENLAAQGRNNPPLKPLLDEVTNNWGPMKLLLIGVSKPRSA